MNVTIIAPENSVMVDGKSHVIDCSALRAHFIHAVQWDGITGHVEYVSLGKTKNPPLTLTSISGFQAYIDAWTAIENAPPPPSAAQGSA